MMRLILVLFISGCAHHAMVAPDGAGLYPYGKYEHAVKIHTFKPDKTMEMRGVVSYSPESVKVIGLSSFGTTIFRISENLKTGEMTKEFYLDVIRRHQDKFMDFYRMIRELMTAPKGQTDFVRGPAHFTLSAPNSAGVYRDIHIEHPQVAVDVHVDEYEFTGAVTK